ncbi:MAG: uroporphyrinogen decarboxylase [Defluviitaleaceae bacterium]|nr:uroporphyrinogen decarboxylase [Defluviitaleaceae bacterium]
MRHEKTPAVPWVPFAGVHAGALKGYNGIEVLKDADKLYESLMEVHKLYQPHGMPITFDLQIEAEILGCDLLWQEYAPPSVKSHPYSEGQKLPCPCAIPNENAGRLPVVLEAMRRVKASVGETTALYGLICGPFTLASHLRGSNIFLDMIKDPEYVKRLVEFCAQVCIKISGMYIDAGMDVIAAVDPLVSQVSPAHIEEMLHDGFKAIFDYIRSKKVFSSFFVCGNATNQIEVMCRTNPDSISVDENVNMPKAKQITDKYNITIGGNIPLTTTMLLGTQQDNMKTVIDLLDSLDHHNLIISPGCDMPYDTPIENTVAAAQAVLNTDACRKIIENYEAPKSDIKIELPDYKSNKKVLIELFTLDSDVCAACTYMLRNVQDVYEEIKDIAEYVEYKYINRENIARTGAMGISNLPTMCLDGEIKWVSIIPDRETFISEIKKYAAKK